MILRKILFLFLLLLHSSLVLYFLLPLFINALWLYLLPVLAMSVFVFRNRSLKIFRFLCGVFIAIDLFYAWMGFAAIQANEASARQGGGLLGGFGEALVAVSAVTAILSIVSLLGFRVSK